MVRSFVAWIRRAPMSPPATPTAALTAMVPTNRATPSSALTPACTARTARANSTRPVPSFKRLSPSTRVRRPRGTSSRRIVATTATGSVAAVMAPTTKASSSGTPTPRCRANATTTADASTPGIASATIGARTGRSSAQSIEYAAAKTKPGTNTPRTRPGVTASPISGKRVAPNNPARTRTTESGSAARRASAATTVAVAISATAARISRSGSVKAISLPTSLPGTPDPSEV